MMLRSCMINIRRIVTVIVLTLSLFIYGCENHDGGNNQDNNYNNESYVTVVVRNDWMRGINILVNNADLYDQVQPGETRYVTRNLIGDEKFSITIWFLNSYGFEKIKSPEYSFDRGQSQYHMNIEAPPDNIQIY